MADKRTITKAAGGKTERKKASLSPEQRSRRIQSIMFGALALIMVLSMLISLVAR
jgi:predicted nucleic acid-binding Zn ribbon protein